MKTIWTDENVCLQVLKQNNPNSRSKTDEREENKSSSEREWLAKNLKSMILR